MMLDPVILVLGLVDTAGGERRVRRPRNRVRCTARVEVERAIRRVRSPSARAVRPHVCQSPAAEIPGLMHERRGEPHVHRVAGEVEAVDVHVFGACLGAAGLPGRGLALRAVTSVCGHMRDAAGASEAPETHNVFTGCEGAVRATLTRDDNAVALGILTDAGSVLRL